MEQLANALIVILLILLITSFTLSLWRQWKTPFDRKIIIQRHSPNTWIISGGS